jgi:hypothetical protein
VISQQFEYDQALLGEVLILRVFIGSAEKYIHNYEMLVLIRISETGALWRHETGALRRHETGVLRKH